MAAAHTGLFRCSRAQSTWEYFSTDSRKSSSTGEGTESPLSGAAEVRGEDPNNGPVGSVPGRTSETGGVVVTGAVGAITVGTAAAGTVGGLDDESEDL